MSIPGVEVNGTDTNPPVSNINPMLTKAFYDFIMRHQALIIQLIRENQSNPDIHAYLEQYYKDIDNILMMVKPFLPNNPNPFKNSIGNPVSSSTNSLPSDPDNLIR